jgi:hypothetical protein
MATPNIRYWQSPSAIILQRGTEYVEGVFGFAVISIACPLE